MKLTNTILPALALGGAALLIAPGEQAGAFTTIGGSLGTGQRDFRVFNNFADPQANNNTSKISNMPGWDGAELAIWKACVEWNSSSIGDGSGDPTQANLGDGGANFDSFFAGAAISVGQTNHNIHSTISSCQSGVLAFAETPISNGWRIRYCESPWVWQDGPGSVGGGIDIQGVAAHEYGHALGLGHSSVNGATMFASISGSGVAQRSIQADDIAGVQFIYGTASGSKPKIQGISLSGSTLTITGTGFTSSGNQVWFTNNTVTGAAADPRVIVSGLSSTAGGTKISVGVPGGAGPGNILVLNGNGGNSGMSNTWPFDPSGVAGQVMISSIVPSTVENLIPGTAETITINGSGFTPSTMIQVNGSPITGSSTFVDGSTLTFEWEPIATLGAATVEVIDGVNSDSATIAVFANSSPTLQVGTGDPNNVVSGGVDVVMAGQPGDLHYLMTSTSNVPSVLPGKIMLDMGNVFTELFFINLFVVGSNGTVSTNVPLPGVTFAFLYWQALDIKLPLSANYPLTSSNLQSIFVL